MLVRNKKAFNLGGLLGISFLGVLLLIFSPVFDGQNGLVFSDNLFNKLSKGSSYFIPKISNEAKEFAGKSFAATFKPDKPEVATKILTTAGVQVESNGADLTVKGDLGALFDRVLADSDAMYHNDGSKVQSVYQIDEKQVMETWWTMLSKIDKELKKQKRVAESDMVTTVMKKGIEPAYNFYRIDAQSVADKAGTMTGLLVFYVAYTMWWGYAIFFLFDGLGLSMKKAKVKKEV